MENVIIKKVLESKTKVRFQDCDPFNHLNNAKYIDYFINAREDQVADNYDLDIHKLAATEGICWVVGSNQISYLRPVFTMETITVETKLINYTANSIQVELLMYNEQKTELKAVMWSSFVHFDLKTKRAIEHAAKYLELFENVKVPIGEKTFEERIIAVKSKK